MVLACQGVRADQFAARFSSSGVHPDDCCCCPLLMSVNVAMSPKEKGDVEQFVTAIGLCTLDTAKLNQQRTLLPGEKGSNCASEVETHAVAIAGRQNTDEARAAVQDFEGEVTEWSLEAAAAWLKALMQGNDFRTVVLTGHNLEFHLKTIKEDIGTDLTTAS